MSVQCAVCGIESAQASVDENGVSVCPLCGAVVLEEQQAIQDEIDLLSEGSLSDSATNEDALDIDFDLNALLDSTGDKEASLGLEPLDRLADPLLEQPAQEDAIQQTVSDWTGDLAESKVPEDAAMALNALPQVEHSDEACDEALEALEAETEIPPANLEHPVTTTGSPIPPAVQPFEMQTSGRGIGYPQPVRKGLLSRLLAGVMWAVGGLLGLALLQLVLWWVFRWDPFFVAFMVPPQAEFLVPSSLTMKARFAVARGLDPNDPRATRPEIKLPRDIPSEESSEEYSPENAEEVASTEELPTTPVRPEPAADLPAEPGGADDSTADGGTSTADGGTDSMAAEPTTVAAEPIEPSSSPSTQPTDVPADAGFDPSDVVAGPETSAPETAEVVELPADPIPAPLTQASPTEAVAMPEEGLDSSETSGTITDSDPFEAASDQAPSDIESIEEMVPSESPGEAPSETPALAEQTPEPLWPSDVPAFDSASIRRAVSDARQRLDQLNDAKQRRVPLPELKETAKDFYRKFCELGAIVSLAKGTDAQGEVIEARTLMSQVAADASKRRMIGTTSVGWLARGLGDGLFTAGTVESVQNVGNGQEIVLRPTGTAHRLVLVRALPDVNSPALEPGKEVVLMGYVVRDASNRLPSLLTRERVVIWLGEAIVPVPDQP